MRAVPGSALWAALPSPRNLERALARRLEGAVPRAAAAAEWVRGRALVAAPVVAWLTDHRDAVAASSFFAGLLLLAAGAGLL
jgi:hypothetical protein